jgi:hypothetical protein
MPRGRSLSPSKRAKIITLRKKRWTHMEIADTVDVSPRSVQRYLNSAGLVNHHPDTFLHGNTHSGIMTKILSGQSVCQVASHYNTSTDAIERIASLNGVGLRGIRIQDSGKFETNLYGRYLKRKIA